MTYVLNYSVPPRFGFVVLGNLFKNRARIALDQEDILAFFSMLIYVSEKSCLLKKCFPQIWLISQDWIFFKSPNQGKFKVQFHFKLF